MAMPRPVGLCILLCVLVLASGRGEEGNVNLGESSAAGEAGIELMPPVATPVADDEDRHETALVMGKAALNSYDAVQSKLMKRATELRHIHDHPPVPDASCKAYSYNSELEECLWSMDSFQYSLTNAFYLKKRRLDDYEQIPGLKVHTSKSMQVATMEECKYQCSKDPTCTGFAFDAPKKQCTHTEKSFINFDHQWDYYEKDLEFQKVPKEQTPEPALKEAAYKKQLFLSQTSQMKEIRSEQSQKAEKVRTSLRQKSITMEARFKNSETQALEVKGEYHKALMEKQVVTTKLKTDKKMYEELKAQDSKVAAKLAAAKNEAAAAASQESKQKADIDVAYLSDKLVSSRRQASQMKEDVSLAKPQEAKAKQAYLSADKAKRKSEEATAELREELAVSESRVDVADKEKDIKHGLSLIADLEQNLKLATLETPFDEAKVETIKEQLLKQKAKQSARVAIQQNMQRVLDHLLAKNREKYELHSKSISKRVEAKKKKARAEQEEKHQIAQKELTAKATAKALREKSQKRAAENLEKEHQAMLEKVEADKVAERQEKQLAKEEALKASQRAKIEKEQGQKRAENAIQVATEKKEKKDKEEQEAQELKSKFAKLKKFKIALEVSNKAEKKAKESQEKVSEREEKDAQVAKEAANKKSVKDEGYPAMREKRSKEEEKEVQTKITKAKEKVTKNKNKKANRECYSKCKSEGVNKEGRAFPALMGCFKDNAEEPAFKDLNSAFDVNSVQWCNQKCVNKSPRVTLFALQENSCWCGTPEDQYQRYGKAHKDKCVLQCPGNIDQLCGGPGVNRVYEAVIPEKTYEWHGHVKNASRPIQAQNYNFEFQGCQCYGVRANATSALLS